MLVHKINGYGVFRTVKGEPEFQEFWKTNHAADQRRKKYDKWYDDKKTKVYKLTMLLEC